MNESKILSDSFSKVSVPGSCFRHVDLHGSSCFSPCGKSDQVSERLVSAFDGNTQDPIEGDRDVKLSGGLCLPGSSISPPHPVLAGLPLAAEGGET